jgi:hypothetical protein
MRIERLTCAPEGGKREIVEFLLLIADAGVAGDRRSAKDGTVSLLSGEAEQEIARMGGLCSARFMANFITRGLDYAALTAGDRLTVGPAELEITRMGKRCFEECVLITAGEKCPLIENCAFARVLRGGEVRAGDEIIQTG